MPPLRNDVARLLLSSIALAACGGPPPNVDEAFRRIQVHEATIANRQAEAGACEADCPARREMRDAAEAICRIAGELDDGDAHARCELARRSAEGAP